MSTDLEKKIDRLIDKLDSNYSASGRTPTGGAKADLGSLTGSFSKIGDGLLRTVDNAGQLVGKAVDNSATVSDATKSVAKVLNEFGTVGGLAGSALTGLSDIVVGAVENWQNFSNFGLQFGGNAIGLNDAVKKTGMTFQQYESILDKMTPAFANFGNGLNRGAEIFGELSSTILNSPKIQRQMDMLGLRTKDVNEALATVVRGAGMIDTTREGAMDKLVNSAVALAREMDMMAKLTGVSRKEQEKTIETMQNDERVRARIVMLRKQNPEAEADIGEVQKSAGALPPAIANLLSESIAGKGIMSSEKIAEFQQVFGPDAAAKIAEIGRKTTSTDANERKEAIAETQNLIFMLAREREKGAAFVAQGAVSNEFSKAAYEDPRMEVITKNLRKYTEEMGEAAALAKIKQEAKDMGMGKLINNLLDKEGNVIAEKGKEDPRIATTQIITDTNSQIKRFGVALNEIVTELNNTITKQKDASGKFVMKEAANKIAGYNKAGGSSMRDTVESIKVEIRALGDMPDNWTKQIGTVLDEKLKGIFSGRSVGSKKSTGSWFETGPKAIVMGEGKQREAVVPEDQVEDFIKDITNLATSSTPSISRPNLSNILKNIPSKVSSAQEAPVEEQKPVGQESTQDKMIDKLSEISTVLAANLNELKAIAGNTRDAASNTKDMGGYIG